MTKLYTTDEAAELLRLSPQTLRLWRLTGKGPRYSKPSRSRCLYAEDDLNRFLEERKFASSSEETTGRGRAA